MASARITLTRQDARNVRDRQILASIDGQQVATLLFGDTVTRELPRARHRLRVNNTLFGKTFDLDLQPDDHARFIVFNRAIAGAVALLALFGAAPYYLRVEQQAE